MGRGVLAQHPGRPVDLRLLVERMQALENQGDKAAQVIMTNLNQTFIALFDPRRHPKSSIPSDARNGLCSSK
jgi:hypothetical protein